MLQQHVALCVLACSQTLYFLFKVCRARVLENKNSEGFIDHSALILTRCVFSKRTKNEKKNKIMSVYRLCVYERIFVSTTEFCHCSKLHKIKSDRICATCHRDKITLLRQRFPQKFSSTHQAIWSRDMSYSLLQQLIT